MDSLVEIRNNEVVVSSRDVAEKFGKEHRHVLESIREIIKAENSALTFYQENTYKAGTGKSYPEYLMNRDGFTLLAMGFTGKDALQWKLKYIAAFNEMEAKLKSGQMLSTPAPAKEAPGVKYYNGVAVVTKRELAAALGTVASALQYYIKNLNLLTAGKDYYIIGGQNLRAFKAKYKLEKLCTTLTLITESGARKIYDYMQKDFCPVLFTGNVPEADARQYADIPGCEEIQKLLRRVQSLSAALNETMEIYNNYNPKDMADAIAKTLTRQAMELYVWTSEIKKCEYKILTEVPM